MDTSSEGYKLIDELASQGNACKYSWSDGDRLECLFGAARVAKVLITEYGLPRPDGFDEADKAIVDAYTAYVAKLRTQELSSMN